jgi:hypothetical protein
MGDTAHRLTTHLSAPCFIRWRNIIAMLHRQRVAAVLVSGVALLRCVGDDSSTTDGGQDATAAEASSEASLDGPATDGPQDAGPDGTAPSHVYAVSFGTTTAPIYTPGLLVFDAPLTNSSQPTTILTSGFTAPTAVARVPIIAQQGTSSQILVVDPAAKKVLFFNLPITPASTPATTLSLDFAAFDGAFDSTGNLWVVGSVSTSNLSGMGERFAPPFTVGPAQTFTVPNATLGSYAILVNTIDQLLVTATPNGTSGHVYNIPTPFDASTPTPVEDNTSVVTPNGILLDVAAAKVFVSSFQGNDVDEFAAPLVSSETPTPLGSGSLGFPARMALSAAGDLTVADTTKGLVVLAAPSFTSTSVTISPQIGDAGYSFRGVAYGP